MNVFTFWEGPMPAYIELCMATWKIPHIVLNYGNLHEFTDLDIEPMKRFALMQIADVVRVHVLRDQGGYWLDADTIMLSDKLPDTDMVGFPETRANTIGLLYSEPHSAMFEEWAEYQDRIIHSGICDHRWSLMGNEFTDPYVRNHKEIRIHPVTDYWPEIYMIGSKLPRFNKYMQFYFEKKYHLSDLKPTDLIMLHNSWVPAWYRSMTKQEVLNHHCTLSNILREV